MGSVSREMGIPRMNQKEIIDIFFKNHCNRNEE
jgi:hypothetical protein